MLTTTVLLAGLLPSAAPPAEARPAVRITVPPLAQPVPADKKAQQQVFAFYLGLFGR